MKKLNFTCSKKWDSMESIDSDLKHCSDCKKFVKDYSKLTKTDFDLTSECGRFNLNQINSFNRSFNISSPRLMQLSLMTLLGLSLSYSDLKAQNQDTDPKVKNKIQKDELIIGGQLINNETKKPLQMGIIELYNSDTMLGVAFTDNQGKFSLSIDTSKHEIKNLRVVFNRETEYSDMTMISNEIFENMIVELDVKTNLETESRYSITGDVTEIEEKSIDCRIRKRK